MLPSSVNSESTHSSNSLVLFTESRCWDFACPKCRRHAFTARLLFWEPAARVENKLPALAPTQSIVGNEKTSDIVGYCVCASRSSERTHGNAQDHCRRSTDFNDGPAFLVISEVTGCSGRVTLTKAGTSPASIAISDISHRISNFPLMPDSTSRSATYMARKQGLPELCLRVTRCGALNCNVPHTCPIAKAR